MKALFKNILKVILLISILGLSTIMYANDTSDKNELNRLSKNCNTYRTYLLEYTRTLSKVISEYKKGFITAQEGYTVVTNISKDINKININLFCNKDNYKDLQVIEANIQTKVQTQNLKMALLKEQGYSDY